jgi:hypothetical protein
MSSTLQSSACFALGTLPITSRRSVISIVRDVYCTCAQGNDSISRKCVHCGPSRCRRCNNSPVTAPTGRVLSTASVAQWNNTALPACTHCLLNCASAYPFKCYPREMSLETTISSSSSSSL